MNYYIEQATFRIIVKDVCDSLDLTIYVRTPGRSDWRINGGVMLSREEAMDLGVALLNMSKNASLLPKKLRLD